MCRNTEGKISSHVAIDTLKEKGLVGDYVIAEAGTVRVFRHGVALEDAIGSHACSLEARACMWPIAFLSGVNSTAHRFHHKLRCNTEVVGYVLLFKTPAFQIGQVPITRMGGIYNACGLGVLPSLAAVTEACADAVRCAFFDRNLHSRMPLVNVPTPARLKRTGV